MILIHDKAGQMCNRLWSQAPFVAFARSARTRVLVPFFGALTHLFEDLDAEPAAVFLRAHGAFYDLCWLNLFRVLRCLPKQVLRWFRVYVDSRRWYAEDWPEAGLRSRWSLVCLSGWNHPNPAVSLLDHHEALRTLYRPAKSAVEKVEALLAEQRKTCDLIVGVHIRRGDYKDFRGGAYFYPEDVYVSYLRQFANDPRFRGKNIGFLLCSNEPVRLAAYAGQRVFQLPEARPIEDLYALSCCDYLMGPPSSFTMWASFYNQVPLRILKDPSEPLDAVPFSPIVALDRFRDGRVFEHVKPPLPCLPGSKPS